MRAIRIAIALPILSAIVSLSSTQPAIGQSGNLLSNPGFEGEVRPYQLFKTALVADSWTPWWVAQAPGDPGWKNRMPEYKAAIGALFPNRVHSGQQAQQYFTFYGTHTAGLYQRVSVTPGTLLLFTIWGQAWSSMQDGDPLHSYQPSPVHMRIGIDPYGGADPFSSNVIWSPAQDPYDVWSLFQVQAVAQSGQVIVFTYSAPTFPVKHNDIYWDDASLVATSAQPVPTRSVSPSIISTSSGPTFQVRYGETLARIAARFGIPMSELAAANGMANTNLLYPGSTLSIPWKGSRR